MLPRWLCITMICVGILFLGGCAHVQSFFDAILGVPTDEEGNPTGPATGGPAAALAGIFGFGNLAQGIAGLYGNIRRRKYLRAGMTMASAVNKVRAHMSAQEDKKIDLDTFIDIIKNEQDANNVRDEVREKFVQPVEHNGGGVPKLGVLG